MPRTLAAVEDWFGRMDGSDETKHREDHRRHSEEFCRHGYLRALRTRISHNLTWFMIQ